MKKILVAIVGAAFLLSLVSACNIANVGGVQGSGNAKSETRNVKGFKEINAGGAVNLEIVTQKDFSLTVEADDNLLEHIVTEVSGDTLKIETKDRISTKSKINIKISMPELKDLDLSGASTASVTNAKTDSLKLNASGASKIKIDGASKSLDATASGASSIDAASFSAENAKVDASGASSITVSASGDLDATASGASSVIYTQEPRSLKQNASGASSIKKK